MSRECGDGPPAPYGSLVVDFEKLTLYRDRADKWRAVVRVVLGDATALVGHGETPYEAFEQLKAVVQDRGARILE